MREVVKARVVNVAFSNDLSKSACMALCLLYRARMSQDSAPEARSRLTQESDLYFAKAVQQLQTGDIPLEAQILAVFDLELYQVSLRALGLWRARELTILTGFCSSSSMALLQVTQFFSWVFRFPQLPRPPADHFPHPRRRLLHPAATRPPSLHRPPHPRWTLERSPPLLRLCRRHPRPRTRQSSDPLQLYRRARGLPSPRCRARRATRTHLE